MTTRINFASKDTADAVREEQEEHLCSDDDKRLKTVAFSSDTPERVIDRVEDRATAGHAEANKPALEAVELTEQEKRDIDFGRDGANVPKARYLKGLGQEYGVDPFQHVDLTEIDGVSDARPILERASQTGGINQGGGAEYDDEATERRERERRSSADAVAGKACKNARQYCEDGDKGACDYLVEDCGFDREEAETLLGLRDDRPTSDGSTEQTELVSVGDAGDEIEVTPQQAGALSRSWQGYKGAISEIDAALSTLRENITDARRAMQAINGVRASVGQGEIDPEKLNEYLAEASEIPESIPEPRRLDQYGDGQTDDSDDSAGGTPRQKRNEKRKNRAAVREGVTGTPQFAATEPDEETREKRAEIAARHTDPDGLADWSTVAENEPVLSRTLDRAAWGSPRSRAAMMQALDMTNPDEWPGVESWRIHPTTPRFSVKLDDGNGKLTVWLDSQTSQWHVNHNDPDSAGAYHLRRHDTAPSAVAIAKRAAERIADGKGPYAEEPDSNGDGRGLADLETVAQNETLPSEMVERLADQLESEGWDAEAAANRAKQMVRDRQRQAPDRVRDRIEYISRGVDPQDMAETAVRERAADSRFRRNLSQEDADALADDLERTRRKATGSMVGKFGGDPQTAADRLDQRRQAGGAMFNAEERGRIKHHAVQGKIASMLRVIGLPDMLARQLIEMEDWRTGADVVAGRSTNPDDWLDLNGVGPARAEMLAAGASVIREGLAEEAVENGGTDPDDVIQKDEQAALGGGRRNAQTKLAGGETGERGQGETIETIEENPGGLMADERDLDDSPDPAETEQGGLEDVGVSEGLRDADQGTLGGGQTDDGGSSVPGFGPANIPDPKIRNLQDAIDHLNTWTDGYGERVSMDADLKRHFSDEGLSPKVWRERQSQDVFRYGIDRVDFMRRWADDLGSNPDDLERHADAIVAFAQDHAAEHTSGNPNGSPSQ